MEHHFRAFSFVDRITSLRPGAGITGTYSIPAGLAAFTASLVGEAVGQLAAWAAMAAVDFKSRPVAGLAGVIELLSPVQPGQMLELAAELESVDEEAVAYGGTASVGGVPVTRLHHCVGPMVKLDDYDDPEAVRARFNLLCGGGAEPGAFLGLPTFAWEPSVAEPGQQARVTLQVPPSADFFADHFPRRPVFPGSLLMESKLRLAALLAASLPSPAPDGRWVLREVSNMKLRAFIPPGERLELAATLAERNGKSARVTLETRNGRRVCGSAQVQVAWEQNP